MMKGRRQHFHDAFVQRSLETFQQPRFSRSGSERSQRLTQSRFLADAGEPREGGIPNSNHEVSICCENADSTLRHPSFPRLLRRGFLRAPAFRLLIAIAADHAVHDLAELARAVGQTGRAGQRRPHTFRIAICYLAKLGNRRANACRQLEVIAIGIGNPQRFFRNSSYGNSHLMRRSCLLTHGLGYLIRLQTHALRRRHNLRRRLCLLTHLLC
jgi:hypothetical protein